MSEVRGIYAALLHQDAKNISMCQLTVRGEKKWDSGATWFNQPLYRSLLAASAAHTCSPCSWTCWWIHWEERDFHPASLSPPLQLNVCAILPADWWKRDGVCAGDESEAARAHRNTATGSSGDAEKKRTEVKQQLVSDSLLCDQTENTVII